MAEPLFSRSSWLNSLHMSTLTVSLLQASGHTAEAVLEGSGISVDDLRGMKRLIGPGQEQHVFANALRLSAQPALGLQLGVRTRISAYGLLGYALLSAPTFGEALRIGLSYPVLLGTYFNLNLSIEGDTAWLVATGYGEEEALRPFNVELCLASLNVVCADLLGQPLPLLAAHFDYSETLNGVRPTATDSPARCTTTSRATLLVSPPTGSTSRCRWPTITTRKCSTSAAGKTPNWPPTGPGWSACASCWPSACNNRRGSTNWLAI